MGSWVQANWQPTIDSGVPRSERRPGTYTCYLPDSVDGIHLGVGGAIAREAAAVERAIQSLAHPSAESLAGIARFLLRSEAIASSQIEGISPSPQQVALAEFGLEHPVRGLGTQARAVANNMTMVRRATEQLRDAAQITVEDIVALHERLLPDEVQHHGLRRVQNWIGRSRWTPLDAEFVPPPPDRVPELVSDLAAYINGATHGPLIQAALAHAQFETIHPFTDGNGRVGRALIHTVLTRRGLTQHAVLPVSLVLATLRDSYVAGLTHYRHGHPAGSPEADQAINQWLAVFIEAAKLATDQALLIARQLEDLDADWRIRVAGTRSADGRRPVPRPDATVTRLLRRLPGTPVVTVSSASRDLGVSPQAASTALNELHRAGIVTQRRLDHGSMAYLALDVLDIVTLAERRLASTQFDTRVAPPSRPTPAAPQR